MTLRGGSPTTIAVGDGDGMSQLKLLRESETEGRIILDYARDIVMRQGQSDFCAARRYVITTPEALDVTGRATLAALRRAVVERKCRLCEPLDGLVLQRALKNQLMAGELTLMMKPVSTSSGIPCILHLTHFQGAAPILTVRMYVSEDSSFDNRSLIALRLE